MSRTQPQESPRHDERSRDDPDELPTLERTINAWPLGLASAWNNVLFVMQGHLGIDRPEALLAEPPTGYEGYYLVEVIRLFPQPLQQRLVDLLWAYDTVNGWNSENVQIHELLAVGHDRDRDED